MSQCLVMKAYFENHFETIGFNKQPQQPFALAWCKVQIERCSRMLPASLFSKQCLPPLLILHTSSALPPHTRSLPRACQHALHRPPAVRHRQVNDLNRTELPCGQWPSHEEWYPVDCILQRDPRGASKIDDEGCIKKHPPERSSMRWFSLCVWLHFAMLAKSLLICSNNSAYRLIS